MTATLESADGKRVLASVHFPHLFSHWHKHKAVLTANGTDPTTRLAFRLGKGRPPERPAGPRSHGTLDESRRRSILQQSREDLAGVGTEASAAGAVGTTGTGDGSPGNSCAQGGSGVLLLDVVSLFPGENGVEGSVSPFRRDLLELIKGLRPR